MATVKIRAVDKSYGSVSVMENISLDAHEGNELLLRLAPSQQHLFGKDSGRRIL